MSATRRMLEITLGDMLWGRRAVFMAIAAGVPVLLAVVLRVAFASGSATVVVNGSRLSTETMFGTAITLLYLRFIVPALGVYYGTSMIADEVEDKTITYLFVRPMRRGAIVLGKYLAYLVCVLAAVLPSAALVFFIMVPFANMGPLVDTFVRDLEQLAVGIAAYGALFVLAGVTFKRPLVGGLIFVFGWEPIASALPGYVGQLTVAHYLQAGTAGMLGLVLASAAAVLLAMRTIEHREYVLEQ
ncbi:MAG TPA: ABC transporter permease [Vicinamibacterales bacterium]|jgi:ABC-type transport system involved in multi-copper enzyme maturation permease subunit|nr:ABC transporter permease [Vicinamibacterales bacterium]